MDFGLLLWTKGWLRVLKTAQGPNLSFPLWAWTWNLDSGLSIADYKPTANPNRQDLSHCRKLNAFRSHFFFSDKFLMVIISSLCKILTDTVWSIKTFWESWFTAPILFQYTNKMIYGPGMRKRGCQSRLCWLVTLLQIQIVLIKFLFLYFAGAKMPRECVQTDYVLRVIIYFQPCALLNPV